MFTRIRLGLSISGIIVLACAAFPSSAYANHAWDDYHWARQSNPFTLTLRDRVSHGWDSYLTTASSDWSKSSVLDTTIDKGGGSRSAKCRPPKSGLGLVKVCSARYGNTGWLGLAKIWAQGDDHITRGTVRLNNTYFHRARYDKPEWRHLAMCQEVGHTLGLDHQDENLDNPNLGTCMDYTRDPNGPPSNEHPNQHDYEQLETIYAHTDSETTVGPSDAANTRDLRSQGRGYPRQEEQRFMVSVAPTLKHTAGVDASEDVGLEGDKSQVAHLGVRPERENASKNVASHTPLVGEVPKGVAQPMVGENKADRQDKTTGIEEDGARSTQAGREQVPLKEGNAEVDSPTKKEQGLDSKSKADKTGVVREARPQEPELTSKPQSPDRRGHK